MSAEHYIAEHVPIWVPMGWPEWTGITDELPSPQEVHLLQTMLGIEADGLPGPQTIEACAAEDYRQRKAAADLQRGGLIVIGPRALHIPVPVVSYMERFELATTRSRRREEAPHQVITHYDVTYSAESTHRVLKKRGYSTHFCVDGDEHGTIWQYHDPALVYTLHGGRTDAGHRVNPGSIGVDLNNPADIKYARGDAQRRGRERGSSRVTIHGHRYDQLNYFPEQIHAFRELLILLETAFGIPRTTPRDDEGHPIIGVVPDAHEFFGVLGHYHLTRRKRDPAPLDWNEVCDD